jgi:membrane-anchored protein YejM (alkaline phosphatase superfamily)
MLTNYFDIKHIKINFANYNYVTFINTLIALIIFSGYIPHALAKPENIYQLLYLIFMHLGNTLVIVTTAWLIFLPIVLFPKIIMRLALPIIITCCLLTIALDIGLYRDFNLHLNTISLSNIIIKSLDLSLFSKDTGVFFLIIAIFLSFEYWLLSKQFKRPNTKNNFKKYYPVIFVADLLMLVVYFSYGFVDTKTKQQLTKLTSYCVALPQIGITAMQSLKQHNINYQEDSPKATLNFLSKKNNYIKTDMQYSQIKKPKNIVIIAIDAWRFDRLNPTDSPNLWSYAELGTRFNNHMSSGNRTKYGLFGLFYGVCANHYYSFRFTEQSPVLIDRLQQLNYLCGIFAARTLELNNFYKVFFNSIINLRLGSTSEHPAIQDQQATDDWHKWYDTNKNNNQPMFSFIFYDSVNAHNFPVNFNQQYKSPQRSIPYKKMLKQYDTATLKQFYNISVSYVDQLAGTILDKLKKNGDLENTMVIITADHGIELNDCNDGYWGYGTKIINHQLQVPFVIIDKDFQQQKPEKVCNDLTVHYDLVPTLMKNFLGTKNNIEDYSIGLDLFGNLKNREWVLISGNYKYFHYNGIITKNYNIKFLPSGFYQILNKLNQTLTINNFLNTKYITKAFDMMYRFAY